MSAKYVSARYSEVFIRRRQLQITQELHEIAKNRHSDFNLIRLLLEEYDKLNEYLEGLT